jgi:hypothetical protein
MKKELESKIYDDLNILGHWSDPVFNECFINIIKNIDEYAKKMCELQKQECANNALFCVGFDDKYSRNSILNCKNVCEL